MAENAFERFGGFGDDDVNIHSRGGYLLFVIVMVVVFAVLLGLFLYFFIPLPSRWNGNL
jgi:hypothetical protein